MQCLLVLHAGELHLLLFLKWSIESHLGKWTLTVDLHDVLPYRPQPLRHRSHRVKQGSFLMQRTFTKSPLWKSWSSSGVRSAIEEVEWTLKDKQDPTKGSKRFMVGRG